jgi:predicted ATPase
LGLLWEVLRAALHGDGRLVLLSGAAGIGKTTLAEALCAKATGAGALALIGRCYDREETPPYGPLLDLLRGYEPGDGLPPPPFSPWLGPAAAESKSALYEHVLTFVREVAAHRPLILLLDDLH